MEFMKKGVKKMDKEYKKGLIDGVTRYAWWKDGVQYVGTFGKTLKQAIEEIDFEIKHMQTKRSKE